MRSINENDPDGARRLWVLFYSGLLKGMGVPTSQVDATVKRVDLRSPRWDEELAAAADARQVTLVKEAYDRVVQDHTKAIGLKPDSVEAYNNRGKLYNGKGDYDRAIQDCTRAIELKPDFAEPYQHRGGAYSNKGDYDRAVADLNRAIELVPGNGWMRLDLFLAKERLGQDGKSALAEWRKSLDEWMYSMEWMPFVRMCLGEITPEQCLAAASDKDSKRDKEKKCQGYYYVGQFYLLRGDKDRARDSFDRCFATSMVYSTEYVKELASLEQDNAEELAGRVGGAVTHAVDMAKIFTDLPDRKTMPTSYFYYSAQAELKRLGKPQP